MSRAGDTLYLIQMKSVGVKRDINGTAVEEHWKTVQRFEDLSIQALCVRVRSSTRSRMGEATKLGDGRFWQKDTNDFVCDVCVMKIPLPGCSLFWRCSLLLVLKAFRALERLLVKGVA